MVAISMNPSLGHQMSNDYRNHGVVIEEISPLIKVYKDGYVERPSIVPNVTCNLPSEFQVVCRDVTIDKFTNIWARIYLPKSQGHQLLPLMVYFHGGGFCVGSASWSVYHEFLAKLSSTTSSLIISVNYRLAPENRLPAAYDDGYKSLMWIKQQVVTPTNDQKWWSSYCNMSRLFLAGDSAGANIAHQVAIRAASQLPINGIILIQPFFGGEERTYTERNMTQPPTSALSLSSSDTYWRLSLPLGANRDNPWCNPLVKGGLRLENMRLPSTMVCISEMDILKDRNMEFCNAMKKAGKKIEHVVYTGVGHAFHILNNSNLSQQRTQEMMSHIRTFISR